MEKEITIHWHIRVRNCIREFHPSYQELSEKQLNLVPDEYWYPDPIHLRKPGDKGMDILDKVYPPNQKS